MCFRKGGLKKYVSHTLLTFLLEIGALNLTFIHVSSHKNTHQCIMDTFQGSYQLAAEEKRRRGNNKLMCNPIFLL